MNNIELTCLKCGHKFKTGDAYSTTSIEQDTATHEFEQYVSEEREQTSMYRCDCGKESCLPVSHPICPKCGRKLDENHKFVPEVKNGCLGFMIIPIIVTIMFLL